MDLSFLNYVDNRKGERLIQGVLLYLLENDAQFKQSFCDWIGWPLFKNIQEEYPEGKHRHDLVLFYENSKKRIELKFWAGWTDSQSTMPDVIDLVIVPKSRLNEAEGCFCKSLVRHWEDLEEKVVNSSNIAKILLSGLDEYYWTPGSLKNYEEYERVISFASQSLEHRNGFFYKFAPKILFNNLSVGNITYSSKAWKGFYIKNSHVENHWLNYLWFGLILNADRWNREQFLEFNLILQICSIDIACKFANLEILPSYIPYDGHNEGIIIKPDSHGVYSIESTWNQCKELLTQYSQLRSEASDGE